MDGALVRRCAHCLRPVARYDFAGGPDLLTAQVSASEAEHARMCPIPVRSRIEADRPAVRRPTRRSSLLSGRR